MVKAARRLGGIVLLAGAATFSGCVQPAEEIVLDAPIVERNPVVRQEPTLLEKFQEISRLYEAETIQRSALEEKLANAIEACRRAEDGSASLKREVKALEGKADELADVSARYGEAQETLFELGKTVRQLRRELLEERLARIKQEQAVVSLKLETARGRRKKLLQNAANPIEVVAREKTAEKEQD